MKKSLKAALYSGLVMPGAGQIILKHYKKGVGLLLTSLLCVTYLIIDAIEQSMTLVDKIISGDIEMTESSLESAIHNVSSDGATTYTIITTTIMVCWIVGIIDAYLCGKKVDEEDRLKATQEQGHKFKIEPDENAGL